MKFLISFVCMFPLLSCSVFWTKSSGSNPRPDGPAKSYEYTYSGTMMYPIKFYEVKRDEDGAVRIAYLKNHGPDVVVIPGPDDFFGRVDALVAEYKLHRLRGSYRPRMQVLDGYGWHVYIRFQRNSISSGGTNAWPPGKLDGGIDAVNGYIDSLIEASTDADVILRQDYREYRH